jgi:undecaprenyl diphosphate synthase
VNATPASAASALGGGQDVPLPRHVAIIMDGNGRWAKARRLPRVAGHKAGVDAVRRTVRAAGDIGIEALTLYAFSSENWRRPAAEIADLMGLLRRFIKSELDEIAREGVKLRIIGDYRKLEPDLVSLLDDAVARTAGNDRLTLAIALNYGGQDEMLRATRRLMREARAGEIDPDHLDDATFEARLDTHGLPRLDLLVRTSGEQRLSNFLLWQAAYAELVFTDTLWPDFDHAHLAAAIETFGRRERRYGGL